MLVLLIIFLHQHLQILWSSPSVANKGAFTFATAHAIFLQASKSMIPQGSFAHSDSNSPSPTTDLFQSNCWIWESLCQPRDPTFAYPASVLSIMTGCISASLWFCNMILKSSGIHLLEWTIRTTKTLIPTGSDDFSLRDSFLHDPPPMRWSRKSSWLPSFGRHWKLLVGSSHCIKWMPHSGTVTFPSQV